MFGTFASPATIVEGRQCVYGATDDAGCGVPPGRGLRPPRKSCDRCHCCPCWTDARLRHARGRTGRTHTVGSAVQAGPAHPTARSRRSAMGRRHQPRHLPSRAARGTAASRRRRGVVPVGRRGHGAAPRSRPSVVGMLDRRRPPAQPVGDPDEGPPLHRRRNRGDAYAQLGSATTVEAARSRPKSALPTSRHGVDCDCRRSRSIPSIGSPEPGAHRSA